MCHSACFLFLYTFCLHCTYLSISVSNCQIVYTHLPKQHIDGINCLHPGEVNRRTGWNVGERYFSCNITNSMEGEPESSWPCSQQPNICPIPEPDKCSPNTPSYFLNIYFNIILPSKPKASKLSLILTFHHRNTVGNSPFPHMCHTPRKPPSWFDHQDDV